MSNGHACAGGRRRQVTLRKSRCSHVPVLVPGWRLLNQTGSATSAIAQDGPSSERGQDTYPDELYRQTDELRR